MSKTRIPCLSMLSWVVVATSLLVGCDGSHLNASPQATFAAREQAVYAVVLAQTFGSRSYVLGDLSKEMAYTPEEQAEEAAPISEGLEDLEANTLLALWSANSRGEKVPTTLQLGAPYALIDDHTLDTLTESDPRGWKDFYDRYPGAPGVLTIAHVGFDSAGTQALAFLIWRAGGLAAWWRYFLLVPNGDTWTIVDDVITVIS